MTFEAVKLSGGTPAKEERLYFPFGGSRSDVIGRLSKGEAAKLDAAVKYFFADTIKPYPGGNDILRVLNELDNIDKHRLILATSHPGISANITGSAEIGGAMVILGSACGATSLTVGNKIFIAAPKGEPLPTLFDVDCKVKGKPVMPVLSELAGLVASYIDQIEKLYP